MNRNGNSHCCCTPIAVRASIRTSVSFSWMLLCGRHKLKTLNSHSWHCVQLHLVKDREAVFNVNRTVTDSVNLLVICTVLLPSLRPTGCHNTALLFKRDAYLLVWVRMLWLLISCIIHNDNSCKGMSHNHLLVEINILILWKASALNRFKRQHICWQLTHFSGQLVLHFVHIYTGEQSISHRFFLSERERVFES